MEGRRELRVAALLCALAACNQWQSSNGEVSRFAINDVQKLRDVDVSTYKLDMELMRQWIVATRALRQAAIGDSVIGTAMRSTKHEPLLRSITRLESDPRALDILFNAGLTPREYVMTTSAYFQASMADDAARATPPGDAPANMNALNVAFIRQHRAELERIVNRALEP